MQTVPTFEMYTELCSYISTNTEACACSTPTNPSQKSVMVILHHTGIKILEHLVVSHI